jgi:hypothetical protein
LNPSLRDGHPRTHQQIKNEDFHADRYGVGDVSLHIRRSPPRPTESKKNHSRTDDEIAFHHRNDELDSNSEIRNENDDGAENECQAAGKTCQKVSALQGIKKIDAHVHTEAYDGAWSEGAYGRCVLAEDMKAVNDGGNPPPSPGSDAVKENGVENSNPHDLANYGRGECLKISFFDC